MDSELIRLLEGRHHDPFSVLGVHPTGSGRVVVRTLQPEAEQVRIGGAEGPLMQRLWDGPLFEWTGEAHLVAAHPVMHCRTHDGHVYEVIEPYSFAPQLTDFDLYLFGEGKHWHAWRFLGSRPHTVDGVEGALFAVWAPNAERVSVVGDFNNWDGRRHPMRIRGGSGVWEVFIPQLRAGELYKYELRNRHNGEIFLKSDPYARHFELRPNTSSRIAADSAHAWNDASWIERRRQSDWLHAPMAIYEVHLGSWQTAEDGTFLGYREIAHRLVEYVKRMGYTHIELMPITEHPFDGSWGYQTTGYFAPTARFGDPDDFRYFVDHCHAQGIGVLLDWVPAHFPKDAFALARFDGTPLYEHEDPRKGEHRDWGTLIFNFGRNEVKNFLLTSALYWIEEFHLDGLRVDAVASMLYLDYSREDGDWVPNPYGGRENIEAIEFLREVNHVIHGEHPGVAVIAEESTSWPQVTRPTWVGGLGFSMKWNMGWMNDSLRYFSLDPIYRQYHHNDLTFGLLYSFSENFVLPFSHDEVVHGKGSMLGKMPGDEWRRFANLRLLYTYQYAYPGKKLLFMGCEFGQGAEWDSTKGLDWWLLQYPLHQGVQKLVSDLNHLYTGDAALHRHDFEGQGFEWIDCHDAGQSIISFLRRSGEDILIAVFNFTPIVRENYRIGVPEGGRYVEVLNSDSSHYGGSNVGNGQLVADERPWMGRSHSLNLTLPPLAGMLLRPLRTP